MWPFNTRWTWADLFATWRDHTVTPAGFLQPQDDFMTPLEDTEPGVPVLIKTPPLLPYDNLIVDAHVFDYRQLAREGRGKAHGTRDIKDVDTILMHQTAALLSKPERFLGVPAHRGIDTDAHAILLHPIRAYMWHGHGANKCSIGYEIACRAAGIEGNPLTLWRSSKEKKAGKEYADLVCEAADAQIETARRFVEYDCAEVARQGGEIKYIGTHRQSHSSRVSDPGSRIYKGVIDWALMNHGLKLSKEFGSGRPNPTAWTGHGAEKYSWRVRGI